MVHTSVPPSLKSHPTKILQPPSVQISESAYFHLQQSQRTIKLLPGMEPSLRIQSKASVNVGASFPLTSKKQHAQTKSAHKIHTTMPQKPKQAESTPKGKVDIESVRSKMRESLSSALATGSKDQIKNKHIENNTMGDEKRTLIQGVPSLQNEDAQGICSVHENQDIVMDAVPLSSHSIMDDELLISHGLSWSSDFDSPNEDSIPNPVFKKPKLMNEEASIDSKDAPLQTSENLSLLIEAELFKLFGGVNKKYKEKGRSLLFNLKDPSNPELLERVLSGDVSPERLCSMTAEELASKELSQWRQAKAEELAQMVVLPEMNIDIRRLVRKTHKGEFQVEVEQDDGAHVEVGLGTDSLSNMPAKSGDTDLRQPRSNDKGLNPKIHEVAIIHDSLQGEKLESDKSNATANLNHKLSEKTDYIQDFVVEELKDADLLPPVVSLDEFMQALDSEPPFENLEVNDLVENPNSADMNLDRSESESIHAYDSAPDISARKVTSVNSIESQLQSENIHIDHAEEKTLWKGFLQLNVSAQLNVVSTFLSGERTSMLEWPSLLEVKGRVRLDAFEKFLQELPLSRTRTIMLVNFFWKEDSLESGRSHLSEAIQSYINDQRLGFAEPVPGVELYLCPAHPKFTGALAKHLPHDVLISAVDGLFGIVVWRRSVPAPSHHHRAGGGSKKHSGQKKHHEGPKSHSGSSRRHSTPRPDPTPRPGDGEDGAPPGFELPIFREEDDLPEFDFAHGGGGSRKAAAGVPRDLPGSGHMRELILKYGQGDNNARGMGIPVQQWNDDDDIPEWNPYQNTVPPPAMPPPPLKPLPYQQQPVPQPNQPFMPAAPLNMLIRPTFFPTAPQQWWPAANGMLEGSMPPGVMLQPPNLGGQLSGGRLPAATPRAAQSFGGGVWRPDNPGSRDA